MVVIAIFQQFFGRELLQSNVIWPYLVLPILLEYTNVT